MAVAEPVVFRAVDGVDLRGGNFIIVPPTAEIGFIADPGVGGEDRFAVIGDEDGAADQFEAKHEFPWCEIFTFILLGGWTLPIHPDQSG